MPTAELRETMMLRRCIAIGLGLTLTLWMGSCAEDTKPDCLLGETATCVGANGCAGTHVCEIPGRFSACTCDDAAVAPPAPPDSSPVGFGCSAGETRACVGPSDCTGVSTCDGSGTFGPCRCPSTTLPPGSRPNVLGAACRTNADCGTSLLCWAENETGPTGVEAGPAGGYCTARCQIQSNCAVFEQTSECIYFGDAGTFGLCFEAASILAQLVNTFFNQRFRLAQWLQFFRQLRVQGHTSGQSR